MQFYSTESIVILIRLYIDNKKKKTGNRSETFLDGLTDLKLAFYNQQKAASRQGIYLFTSACVYCLVFDKPPLPASS